MSLRPFFKWTSIVLGTLVGLLLVLILVLYFFDWNRLRAPISSAVSTALGRPFAINGDMRMEWSWTPRLTIHDIELANASWGKQRQMITLDRVQASLRIRELFKGHIVLPEVEFGKPRVLLEKNAEGKANWDFQMADKKKEETPMDRRWFPKIERLTIENGRFGYNDPLLQTQLDMAISTAVGKSNEQSVKLSGSGRLQKEQFTMDVEGGSILDLWNTEKAFPIDIKVEYGKTRAKVSGTMADPMNLSGPNLSAELSGPDLAVFSPFTRVPIPQTPPYRFATDISRNGDIWNFKNLQGKLGNSDIAGNLTFTVRNERPLLEGDVNSKKLDFRDFSGFIGVDPRPEAPPRPKLFPDVVYDVVGLRLLDVDIRFKSDNIVTPKMPIDRVRVNVKLDRGLLELKPAEATIGLGRIVSNLMVNARKSKILTYIEAKIDKVPFKRLLEKTPFEDETAGEFVGKINLTGAGNSIAEMAATADGGITVIMENGRISGLMIELAGLDVVESLGILVNEDPSLLSRCTIADFIVVDGIVKTKLFLMDTTDSNILGEGQIDLRTETIDMRISTHPKDISLFSLRTPIHVTGTLKKPRPFPELLPLATKLAASVGLGVLAGPAAILPWMDYGLAQDSPCQTLLKAAAKQNNIPLPGNTATGKTVKSNKVKSNKIKSKRRHRRR